MFTLKWMPHPESVRDEIDTIMGHELIEELFCWVNDTLTHKSLSWTMDGDGFSSAWIVWDSELGQFYITRS